VAVPDTVGEKPDGKTLDENGQEPDIGEDEPGGARIEPESMFAPYRAKIV
jgi:hypothetical protein